MTSPHRCVTGQKWAAYYRGTASRPPRELLLRGLEHVEWEGRTRRRRRAVEIGFGAGNDALELLRRGWQVLATDREPEAAKFLARRVPARYRASLTVLIAPMEELAPPPADLVYASYSLPFCAPEAFGDLWARIRRSLVPGGHFVGQLFGDRDEWAGKGAMTFHTLREVRALTRGYRVELLRETEEDGRSFAGPKHWHFFDLVLEKPRPMAKPGRRARVANRRART
jgi:tellurite methyltransferase